MYNEKRKMRKKYWASVMLPFCCEKGFFEDYKEIGDWILELLPISKKKFDQEQERASEKNKISYPNYTLSEICNGLLHVVNVENGESGFVNSLRESKFTIDFHKERKRWNESKKN
jgi:hypothetical protein